MRTYEAPLAGFYMMSGKITHYRPTGRFHLVPNRARYWFQFWRPILVLEEIYEVVETWEGQEVRKLKAGDKVELGRDLFYRLGS